MKSSSQEDWRVLKCSRHWFKLRTSVGSFKIATKSSAKDASSSMLEFVAKSPILLNWRRYEQGEVAVKKKKGNFQWSVGTYASGRYLFFLPRAPKREKSILFRRQNQCLLIYNIDLKASFYLINKFVDMSEWLRRQTRNLLGFACAGSNPAVDVFYFDFLFK